MSQIDKLRAKFYRKPIPNDIRVDEAIKLAEWYGCKVEAGGKHPLKVIHPASGTVIPIPVHGDTIQEAYIKQLKDLFNKISCEEER